jgi:16S rRNA (guanine527-N7)-methyltransferase
MTGAEEFASRLNVSRETLSMFQVWQEALEAWQERINLVSPNSLVDFWDRHALDSAQLAALVPEHARTLADLGSGAGFPVIAIAILLRDREGFEIVAIESNAKKTGFLRDVVTRLGLKVKIVNQRIEEAPQRVFDIVTARALAPLELLADYAQRFSGPETLWIFPKGAGYEAEWRAAILDGRFERRIVPSLTDEAAGILLVKRKTIVHGTN